MPVMNMHEGITAATFLLPIVSNRIFHSRQKLDRIDFKLFVLML
jgi:hypothetical protein